VSGGPDGPPHPPWSCQLVIIDPCRTPRRAEIAFLVEEDFHGLGIAGRLLKHLAHLAREQGVSQFEAEVLPQNQAMLAVFSRSGLAMQQDTADGAVHVTLSLAGPSATA
jgi:RimJ/RimL family protein N-acetyltransferase